jgi:hypothetical protein
LLLLLLHHGVGHHLGTIIIIGYQIKIEHEKVRV